MLENLIEIYLTSIKELQFFSPFKAALEEKGFYDVHIVHGKNELGRDIIAKKKNQKSAIQFSFQLKVGNINLSEFRKDARPQLYEASTSTFPHPNFDNNLPHEILFVTTGSVTENVVLSLNELNTHLSKTGLVAIKIWDKGKVTKLLISSGIETFFSVHQGLKKFNEFYHFYNSIIQNADIDFVYIENYSKRWLEREWNNSQNRLQTFFEAYFLSKTATENGKLYEATLINSALIRCLIKNEDFESLDFAVLYFYELTQRIIFDLEKGKGDRDLLMKLATKSSLLNIFSYPIICFRILELLALQILISSENYSELIEKAKILLIEFINKEPGSYRPISDNYTTSVLFICLALLKLNEIDLLKKYINNTTIWICDRFEEIGLSYLGSTIKEEIEQLISENLDSFEYNTKNASFLASTILYISVWIDDKDFYSSIANEFKATEIIAQYFHIIDSESLFTYDSESIVDSHDHIFSTKMSDEFSDSAIFEKKKTKIDIPNIEYLFVMQLMRDRVFPFQIRNLILP